MPKGHSADPTRITTLRELLDAEPSHGKTKLAGVALSYATGHAEHSCSAIVAQIHSLRHEQGFTDGDILRLLCLPKRKGYTDAK